MGNFVDGDKLKKLRMGMGWSQIDLAERIGVASSAVSMYEGGQREPARETLVRIASAFRVPVDELLKMPRADDSGTGYQNQTDNDTDFGFSISRSKRLPNGGFVSFAFKKGMPCLTIDGVTEDFAAAYKRLCPEDKVSVCKEMLRRAKDELLRG